MEPDDERVHMNRWIARGTPPEQETEIVIPDFRFRALGSNTGAPDVGDG